MAEELSSVLDLVVEKALEPQADHSLFVWQLLLLKSLIVGQFFEFGALFYISSTLEHFLDLWAEFENLRFFGNI